MVIYEVVLFLNNNFNFIISWFNGNVMDIVFIWFVLSLFIKYVLIKLYNVVIIIFIMVGNFIDNNVFEIGVDFNNLIFLLFFFIFNIFFLLILSLNYNIINYSKYGK